MYAKDFRAWAREALFNHWGVAMLVCLLAGLLGGGIDMLSSSVTLNVDTMEVGFGEGGLLNSVPREVWAMMVTVTVVTMIVAFIIGGAVLLGRCTFFTKLMKHEDVRIGDLFSQFHRLWDGFKMQFVVNLVILLWSLLLVVPGIIASYNYCMVPYLMAEFPELRVRDAMKESKRIMRGNKWRLVCMQLSFFGWNLLALFTMGLLGIWLAPYMNAAEAAFYMEITGRSGIRYAGQRPSMDAFRQNRGPEL